GCRCAWVWRIGCFEVQLQGEGLTLDQRFVTTDRLNHGFWTGNDRMDTVRYFESSITASRLHGADGISGRTFGGQGRINGGVEDDKALRDDGNGCFWVLWVVFDHGRQVVFCRF